MKETLKLGFILLIIASVSALVLSASNNATCEKIAEADRIKNDEARREVFADANEFEAIDESKLNEIIENNSNILEVYQGLNKDGHVVGYTFKTVTSGYGGDVQVITGISMDGTITGMKVVNHNETPGLGAKSENPEFQERFEGKSVESELVVMKGSTSNDNEIQALTGATITSKAVTLGVNSAREVFNTEFAN